LWYTVEGHDYAQRLWKETMEELNFVGAESIIDGMKK
jgi:hypothetical protein